jgi:hypothetical protein
MKACYSDYLQCAAWSSTDENGEPLDSYQFSDVAEKNMRKDLDGFIYHCKRNGSELLTKYEQLGGTPEQFAHDFWLTRNGHGAGFWDRGLGEIGDILTTLAHLCGSVDLYLNEETQEIEVC